MGDGPEEDALKALHRGDWAWRTGSSSSGASPRRRWRSTCEACDVFVLNTRYEGLSHTLLECMDAGIPVVATAVGGNMELVEDGVNGFLVPVDDREEIVAAVSRAAGTTQTCETTSSRGPGRG